jgi:hypothetical protein
MRVRLPAWRHLLGGGAPRPVAARDNTAVAKVSDLFEPESSRWGPRERLPDTDASVCQFACGGMLDTWRARPMLSDRAWRQ